MIINLNHHRSESLNLIAHTDFFYNSFSQRSLHLVNFFNLISNYSFNTHLHIIITVVVQSFLVTHNGERMRSDPIIIDDMYTLRATAAAIVASLLV